MVPLIVEAKYMCVYLTFAGVVLILVHQSEISDSRPKHEYTSLAHEQEYAWCDCSDLTIYI